MSNQSFKPTGYHSVNISFHVSDIGGFVGFLTKAFDAVETERTTMPDGTIAIVIMKIGDSYVEISSAREDYPATKVAVHLYVENVEETYERALAAGGSGIYKPVVQPYGDKECFVQDAFGNSWYVATHLSDDARSDFGD